MDSMSWVVSLTASATCERRHVRLKRRAINRISSISMLQSFVLTQAMDVVLAEGVYIID